MGCGCGLNPYEECAFLLKDFNKLVLQRKALMDRNLIQEKRKTDNKALNYRKKIYNNLENINNKHLTRIEMKKLKQLNDLFLALLTEESNIKKKDASNNFYENGLNDRDILIMNTNKFNVRNNFNNQMKKKGKYINLNSS